MPKKTKEELLNELETALVNHNLPSLSYYGRLCLYDNKWHRQFMLDYIYKQRGLPPQELSTEEVFQWLASDIEKRYFCRRALERQQQDGTLSSFTGIVRLAVELEREEIYSGLGYVINSVLEQVNELTEEECP